MSSAMYCQKFDESSRLFGRGLQIIVECGSVSFSRFPRTSSGRVRALTGAPQAGKEKSAGRGNVVLPRSRRAGAEA
jgi:hypothetical protein